MKINSKGFIEPCIGEIFSSAVTNGVKCQVVSDHIGCGNCIFEHFCNTSPEDFPLACSSEFRDDKEEVRFVEIE